MVFAGLFPTESDAYPELRSAGEAEAETTQRSDEPRPRRRSALASAAAPGSLAHGEGNSFFLRRSGWESGVFRDFVS